MNIILAYESSVYLLLVKNKEIFQQLNKCIIICMLRKHLLNIEEEGGGVRTQCRGA